MEKKTLMQKIPKTIHYCWFGDSPIPDREKDCIASWKKYCPDYDIKMWNETNFDIDCCCYVKEAYAAKKWAFVSDYARFWIIYHFGGIYFDTDVELIKPIDKIIEAGPFLGLEKAGMNGKSCINIAPGLGLAAEKGNLIYKEILSDYERSSFINRNGKYDQTTVVSRITDIFSKYGYIADDRQQKIMGITIYPSDFFCPYDYNEEKLNLTGNTISIHWYSASWKCGLDLIAFQLYKKKLKGRKIVRPAYQLFYFIIRVIQKIKDMI